MLLADQYSQEMDDGRYVTQEDFEAGLKQRGLLISAQTGEG
jgi:hypothetical protein